MLASFVLIFAAFAICQAVLTVKLADILSPKADADHVSATPRAVGAAKLA